MHEPTACMTYTPAGQLIKCAVQLLIWPIGRMKVYMARYMFNFATRARCLNCLLTALEVKFSEAMSSSPCTCSKQSRMWQSLLCVQSLDWCICKQHIRAFWYPLHLAALFLLDNPVHLLIYFLQGTIMLEHLLVCKLQNRSDCFTSCVGTTS